MCGRDRKKFKLFPVEGKQPPSSRESLLDVSARDNDARVLGWGRSSDVCEQRRTLDHLGSEYAIGTGYLRLYAFPAVHKVGARPSNPRYLITDARTRDRLVLDLQE